MSLSNKPKNTSRLLILVAALGYFVDVYDLILFLVERRDSLLDLMGSSTSDAQLMERGAALLNWQMFGMMMGGIVWGILGDKKGRLFVLFGSILTYSLANIANGFIENLTQYAVLRFISGFGLAGELGAGITLVSETMSKEKRGYGTMIVATIGVFGAVVAGFMGGVITNWRWSYFLGGGMGLLLLLMRIGILESGMFEKTKESNVVRGSMKSLFANRQKFLKYIRIIFVAVPVWYVMGILIGMSPEIAKLMKMKEAIRPDKSIMFAYTGITIGDLVSGMLSQWMRSRKKVLFIFLSLTALSVFLYFQLAHRSVGMFYLIATLLGFASGFWAVFMATASELFGTNIRSTVTTTAPNFVRGAVILINFGFIWIAGQFYNSCTGGVTPIHPDEHGRCLMESKIMAAQIVGVVVLSLAFLSLWKLEETYGKELDYNE